MGFSKLNFRILLRGNQFLICTWVFLFLFRLLIKALNYTLKFVLGDAYIFMIVVIAWGWVKLNWEDRFSLDLLNSILLKLKIFLSIPFVIYGIVQWIYNNIEGSRDYKHNWFPELYQSFFEIILKFSILQGSHDDNHKESSTYYLYPLSQT